MESPITAVKAALKPSAIIKSILMVGVALLIIDAIGFTDYFLYPWSTINAKFAKGKLPGGSERPA